MDRAIIDFVLYSCRAISSLEAEANGLSSFKLAFYYCEGVSTTPELVLRSLCRQLARSTDGSLLPRVLEVHTHWTRPGHDVAGRSDWAALLGHLIDVSPVRTVIVIDALDECDEPKSLVDDLGDLMIQRFEKVSLLCSSQEHITINEWLPPDRLRSMRMVPKETKSDMDVFIEGAIESRNVPGVKKSIFCMFRSMLSISVPALAALISSSLRRKQWITYRLESGTQTWCAWNVSLSRHQIHGSDMQAQQVPVGSDLDRSRPTDE
jgi:hypothetical protein